VFAFVSKLGATSITGGELNPEQEAGAEVSARSVTVRELFMLGVFEPARVQREYQWDEDQASDLFKDVFRTFQNATGLKLSDDPADEVAEDNPKEGLEGEKPVFALPRRPTITVRARPHPTTYFLGHMVLLPRSQKATGYFIFDGQQRMTTLAILLSVFRDRLEDDGAELDAVLVDAGEPRLKISSPGGSLSWIMRRRGGSRRRHRNAGAVDKRMMNAASLFHERLNELDKPTILNLLNFVLGRTYLSVTCVRNIRQAQIMFETANSRGKALSPVDVLKGHIIREIEAYLPGEAPQVEREWNKTRQDLGRHFPDFIRAIDFTWFREDRSDGISDDLLELFDGEVGASKALSFVKRDFVRYRDGFSPIAALADTDDASGVMLGLRQLSFLPWREWQPLAMAIFVSYPLTHKRALSHIQNLVRASYIMCVLGWADWPDRRAAAFGRALEQIEMGLNPFAANKALSFRPDRRKQARAAFQASMPSDRVSGPVVRWLETLRWPEPVPAAATRGATLEHVLPRAHGADWEDCFPDENDREACKNLLGNFCLIPRILNMELGNDGWAQKRKAYAALPSHFKSAHEVGAKEKWHTGVVRERTRELAQLASQALGLN
jgi:hypothetical protein